MKRYMVCFTNGQFIKIIAENLTEDGNDNIIFSTDEKIIGIFNQKHIAGWVIVEEL